MSNSTTAHPEYLNDNSPLRLTESEARIITDILERRGLNEHLTTLGEELTEISLVGFASYFTAQPEIVTILSKINNPVGNKFVSSLSSLNRFLYELTMCQGVIIELSKFLYEIRKAQQAYNIEPRA